MLEYFIIKIYRCVWQNVGSVLILYNRQMRYQSKAYRSLSFVHRDSNQQKELRDNKDNKENNNIVNLPNRPNKRDLEHPLCKLKLEHKITETTTCSLPLKDSYPQQLKKTYSQLIAKDYSTQILTHLITSTPSTPNILAPHSITSSLRSKMVDWMIEVLSSYKMTEQTFFRSVFLMDGFMQRCGHKLQIKDLHLIGVTAMFSAAKYEEIHPLKLNVLYDKIARKKFKKTQILDKESDIVKALDFALEVPSVYDIARHILQEINIPLNEPSRNYFAKIVLYLSKMALFNHELAEEKTSLLACGVVFIALKTLEQVDGSAQPEARLPEVGVLMGLEEEVILEVSRKVLELAKNFSKIYPTLTNLKKFNKFEYGVE